MPPWMDLEYWSTEVSSVGLPDKGKNEVSFFKCLKNYIKRSIYSNTSKSSIRNLD